MTKPLNAVNLFTVVIGIVLLIEGFWGLFSPTVFGIFSTNILHACIHLVLGAGGIFYGLRNRARNYSMYVGILLLVVGVCYFLPTIGPFLTDLFNLNQAVAIFNTVVGALAIVLAITTPKAPVSGQH